MQTATVTLTTKELDILVLALNSLDSDLIEARKKSNGDAWLRSVDKRQTDSRDLALLLIEARRYAPIVVRPNRDSSHDQTAPHEHPSPPAAVVPAGHLRSPSAGELSLRNPS
jgi:hypothetical protein